MGARDAVAPERQSRSVNKGQDRCRCLKLLAHGRQSVQQAIPRWLPFVKSQLIRQLWCGGDTGTRQSVVKAQDPDPTSVEDVVERRVIRRIRRRLSAGYPAQLRETKHPPGMCV